MSVYARPVDADATDLADAAVDPGTSAPHAVPKGRPDKRLWFVVGLILLAGVGLRLVNVGEPMFEYHPTRQYISVDVAWKYDIALGAQTNEGDREAAQIRTETEPPIMEGATAAIWRLIGDRPLWVPRVLTIVTWAAGGLVLTMLLQRLGTSSSGVVAGVAAWTFIPFVVQATRVFQPDPLMVVAIVFAVLGLVVDDERRTAKSLLIAGVAAGFAVFVKIPASFFVVAAFGALTWFSRGPQALWSRRTAVFGLLALLPAIVYNLLGLVVIGFLKGKQNNFVFPRMLTTADFWDSWMSLVLFTFTGSLVLLSAAGIIAARGRARVVGVSLLAGYVAYGLVFTWNYSTHDYYHLPLVVVVALGVGLAVTELESLVRRRRADLVSVAVATIAIVLFIGAWTSTAWPLVPPRVNATEVDRRVRVYAAVGDAVDHSDRVLAMVEDYGYPLAYYGSVRSRPWPMAGDRVFEAARGDAPVSIADRFDELAADEDAEFFVVVDFDEWDLQTDLQEFLRSRYPVYAETADYLVFDLRSNVASGG